MKISLEIDNRSLVEECLKGDKEALNLFYLRFAPRMQGVIRRYVHDSKDAEDILHDGFIVAFTRLKSLRDRERVDYWLATIMKNLALRFLQEQDVTELLTEDYAEEAPAIDNIIDMEVLESLIKKLPTGYQKVFRLSMLEKKSHKEIAQILGIAPNSSSSQLFHAKLMMRQLITDYRKQTGILSLLLLGIGAGTIFWIDKLSTVSDKNFVATDHPTILTDKAVREENTLHPTIQSATESMIAGATVKPKLSYNSSQPTAHTVSEEEIPTSSGNKSTVPENVANTLTSDSNLYETTENDRNESDITVNTDAHKGLTDVANENNDADNRNEDIDNENKDVDSRNKDILPIPSRHNRESYIHKGFHSARHSSSQSGGLSLVAKADIGFALAINSNNSDMSNGDLIGNPGFNDPNIGDSDSDGKDKTRYAMHEATGGKAPARYSDFTKYSNAPHKNDFPISFTLAVRHGLTEKIGLEAGISYTYLSTNFETWNVYSHCQWHYLGIPLHLTFRSFTTGRLKLYGAVGGSLEIPLRSSAHISGASSTSYLKEGSFHSPCVWTLSGSYGAALKLSNRFDIFIEPTLHIYLNNKATVPNIWSDNPLGFSLPIGLRLNL